MNVGLTERQEKGKVNEVPFPYCNYTSVDGLRGNVFDMQHWETMNSKGYTEYQL